MFELSIGEIILFTLIALIVLGPERLPALARFIGRWFAKIQNLVHNVKADIGAELALDDLKNIRDEFHTTAQNLRQDLQLQAQEFQNIKNDFHQSAPWDNLPTQRTPADFGIDDMMDEAHWVAEQQLNSQNNNGSNISLSQHSRRLRKQIRPYQHITRFKQPIGARRQQKYNRHG